MGKSLVAPGNPQRSGIAAPTAAPRGGKKPSTKVIPSANAPKVDLTTLSQEYERRRQLWATYFNQKLIPIDNYAEGRRSTDYLTILGPDGSNLIYQVQDQTIRNVGEKTIAFVTPDSVKVSVPLDLNPQMADDQRDAVANVFRAHWDVEALYHDYDPQHEELAAFTYRGNCVKSYWWHDQNDASNGTAPEGLPEDWPICTHHHDILSVAPLVDSYGRTDSIIIGEKLFASMIPPAELKKLGTDKTPSDEVETWTYIDRFQWGRTIDNNITQPLTPHGFTYADGVTPMCPVNIGMFRAGVIRNGSVAPQASGISQIGRRIGRPVVYDLLSASEILSRVQTVQMENIRRVGLAVIYEKGRVKRPNDTGLDLTEVSIELDDKGEIGFVSPPDVNKNADNFTGNIRQNMSAPAGVDNALLSGPQNIPNSGISAAHMTTWPRAAAQQLALAYQHFKERECQIIAGMCVSKLQASPIDAVQHHLGERLPTTGGTNDPLAQGTELIFSGKVAGQAVTDLTFAGFRRAKVDVSPDTRMTPEGKAQLGTQLLLAKDPQTGKPVLPLPVILTKFFDGYFEAPEEVERAIVMDDLASLPGSPLKNIQQMEAAINRYGALLGEDQTAALQTSLTQYIQTALPQFVQSLLAGAANPVPPPQGAPPNAPAPPNAQNVGQNGPLNAPPAQGPPMSPQGPPMLPGQLPPVQPPGSPMAMPPGPMAPGGGNPAAMMPQPPQQQGPVYG